ncbi:MAG: polysaccharide deacetylase family protein, partial [Planctomycetota bacterium]
WDNFEIVAPILERHDLRATFFVTSNFVETDELMWFDRAAAAVRKSTDAELLSAARANGIEPPSLGELANNRLRAWIETLKRTPPSQRSGFVACIAEAVDEPELRALFRSMRPAQVTQMARKGHEIGSHSASHEILPLASDEELDAIMNDSRDQVQAWTGTEVPGFCYPDGSHDDRVVSAARRAGYRYACTTEPPTSLRQPDPLRLGRFDITRDRVSRPGGAFDLVAFRAEMCGLHDRLR